MDLTAPTPSTPSERPVKKTPPTPVSVPEENTTMSVSENYSAVSLTIAGCGGCGINLSRMFKPSKQAANVLYFDTSMTNSRHGEDVYVIGEGHGSGSRRAEHARDIERLSPQITDLEIGASDVAVVMFSLAGGSGSVIAPIMIREYARRGMRVIGVAVADTSYAVGAKNTLNTLKTLTAIAKNNDLYLPLIVLSNDEANSRQVVNDSCANIVSALLDTLTKSVYEVDRNDRLNWINPSKVIDTTPGLKLMSFVSDKNPFDNKVVLGTSSKEMVDSVLIFQSSPDEVMRDNTPLPISRLKKTGFYAEPHHPIVAKVTSDISAIESIIDKVEKMQHQEKAQKYQDVSRLSVDTSTNGDSDLIL